MIKNNHDGTITLIDVWTACSACGQKVTGDSIHTCSPQLKTLTDEEIIDIAKEHIHQRLEGERFGYVEFARAILKKAQEK
jgi:hypothetical protein